METKHHVWEVFFSADEPEALQWECSDNSAICAKFTFVIMSRCHTLQVFQNLFASIHQSPFEISSSFLAAQILSSSHNPLSLCCDIVPPLMLEDLCASCLELCTMQAFFECCQFVDSDLLSISKQRQFIFTPLIKCLREQFATLRIGSMTQRQETVQSIKSMWNTCIVSVLQYDSSSSSSLPLPATIRQVNQRLEEILQGDAETGRRQRVEQSILESIQQDTQLLIDMQLALQSLSEGGKSFTQLNPSPSQIDQYLWHFLLLSEALGHQEMSRFIIRKIHSAICPFQCDCAKLLTSGEESAQQVLQAFPTENRSAVLAKLRQYFSQYGQFYQEQQEHRSELYHLDSMNELSQIDDFNDEPSVLNDSFWPQEHSVDLSDLEPRVLSRLLTPHDPISYRSYSTVPSEVKSLTPQIASSLDTPLSSRFSRFSSTPTAHTVPSALSFDMASHLDEFNSPPLSEFQDKTNHLTLETWPLPRPSKANSTTESRQSSVQSQLDQSDRSVNSFLTYRKSVMHRIRDFNKRNPSPQSVERKKQEQQQQLLQSRLKALSLKAKMSRLIDQPSLNKIQHKEKLERRERQLREERYLSNDNSEARKLALQRIQSYNDQGIQHQSQQGERGRRNDPNLVANTAASKSPVDPSKSFSSRSASNSTINVEEEEEEQINKDSLEQDFIRAETQAFVQPTIFSRDALRAVGLADDSEDGEDGEDGVKENLNFEDRRVTELPREDRQQTTRDDTARDILEQVTEVELLIDSCLNQSPSPAKNLQLKQKSQLSTRKSSQFILKVHIETIRGLPMLLGGTNPYAVISCQMSDHAHLTSTLTSASQTSSAFRNKLEVSMNFTATFKLPASTRDSDPLGLAWNISISVFSRNESISDEFIGEIRLLRQRIERLNEWLSFDMDIVSPDANQNSDAGSCQFALGLFASKDLYE